MMFVFWVRVPLGPLGSEGTHQRYSKLPSSKFCGMLQRWNLGVWKTSVESCIDAGMEVNSQVMLGLDILPVDTLPAPIRAVNFSNNCTRLIGKFKGYFGLSDTTYIECWSREVVNQVPAVLQLGSYPVAQFRTPFNAGVSLWESWEWV